MITLRTFWYYLIIACGICSAVFGAGGYRIGYDRAPDRVVVPQTACFGQYVEINSYGSMTDVDRQIIEDCGYENRLTTPTP